VECFAWSRISLKRVSSELVHCHDPAFTDPTSIFRLSVKLSLVDVLEHTSKTLDCLIEFYYKCELLFLQYVMMMDGQCVGRP
jgi:hypothetical protein